MANFSFTVDTQEMADSIDGVTSHVGGVTTAVVGMQTMVVAAEEASAHKICAHVDRGIFSLIRSQITQKAARLRSEVDSRLLEMRQQSQTLVSIKSRMERDYQMIAARYVRLFQAINASLRNRVFELDKEVSTLVHRDMEQLTNRTLSLQAQVLIHHSESAISVQYVAAAQTKRNANRAMAAMQGFVSSSHNQASMLKGILSSAPAQGPDLRCLPVLLAEVDVLSAAATQWSVYCPTPPGISQAKDSIQRTAFNALPALQWRPLGTEALTPIAAEYRKLVERSGLSERLKAQMNRLFETSGWMGIGRA